MKNILIEKLIFKSLVLITFCLVLFSCSNNSKEEKKQIVTDTVITEKVIEIDTFQLALNEFLNDSSLFNASISFYFTDDSTNEVILQHNQNLALVPASTMKILTTATALEFLGGNRSFNTKIQYNGNITDGVLNGNIFIKGGGDPTLGSKFYSGKSGTFFSTWADEIIALGIDSISGYILGDASFFDEEYIPATWSWGEIGEYYCTGACGLTIFDNQYTLKFYSGRKKKTLAEMSVIEPFIPNFYFENKSTVDASEKLLTYILCAPYNSDIVIKGTTPSGSATYSIVGSIPDPPLLAAYNLHENLLKKGIKINKGYSTTRKLKIENDSVFDKINSSKRTNISTKWSANISSIVGVTNLRSNNLFAETLLNHIGLNYSYTGSNEAGCEAVLKIWEEKGLDTRGLNIFDGSGVSRYNSITSKQLVDVLKYMKDSSNYYETFYNSLPISGETGTLKYFCDSIISKGKIHAKSGTMSRVRSYAGYIETNSNNKIIFAIVINNYNCTNSEMKEIIENFLINVIKFK